MARQSFIWTALPNGYTPDGTSLRMSILLSPRLDPQSSPHNLTSFFPDWADWPTTLGTARFHITYNGQTVTLDAHDISGPRRVNHTLGAPDTAVWKALFRHDLLVRPHAFEDLSDYRIASYDAVRMAEIVQTLYRELARKADGELPKVTDLIDDRLWATLIGTIRELDLGSVDRRTGLRDPGEQRERLPSGGRGVESLRDTIERFQIFHTPLAKAKPTNATRTDDPRIEATWLEYERGELPKREDISKALDFHQIVGAMGSYPTLLRRLGLVVDVLLPADSFPHAPDADLSVRVAFPASTLQINTHGASPRTRTELSPNRFQAVSNITAPFQVRNGLLDLDPARFCVLQVDVDGAGLKLMNFARSVGRRVSTDELVESVSRHESRIGAPALRTDGLMLVHRQRASALASRFDASKAGNAALQSQFQGGATGPALHAEDLVRGYHIDIWDATTAKWRSLCRRSARYELDNGNVVVEAADEEGTLRLAATKPLQPSSVPKLMHLHEALVSWNGWSLAAPMPGRAIGIDDGVDTTQPETEAEIPPGLDFRSRFKAAKGSLPRLRFGRAYAFRARAVDLAGNSLPPQIEPFGSEHPGQNVAPFLRYEPLEAPVIALLSTSGVIETPKEGESIARIAIRSFNDTPDLDVIVTTEVARRAAVPPRVSARDAELHGRLDGPGRVDSTAFALLANQKDLAPNDPGAALREAQIPMKGPLDNSAVKTTFAVYEAGRALPFLPDPLAVGIAARVLDHPNIAETELIWMPLYPAAKWPEAQAIVIEVYDDPVEKPYFEATTRRLRMPLPKAVRARVRLSMTLTPEGLDLLGVYAWLDYVDRAALRDRALQGQHWMLTPWREIELVHAVQRPLATPEITSIISGARKLGSTSAQPVIHANVSIASTDRLDLYGEWHEPLDDPAAVESTTGPVDRVRHDAAFQVKVTDPKSYAQRLLGAKDGGYPDHTLVANDAIGVNNVVGGPSPPVQMKSHEFHDTRYRRIEYWFDATTRFREYLPSHLLTIERGGETIPIDRFVKVTGQRVATWIPSSAPPPAPNVLYVVPTFGWARAVQPDGGFSSQRRGSGLRVYLDRPWNASGYGEMLAVVLPPADFEGDPDSVPQGKPYKDYVSQWGNDPAWDSAFVRGLAPRRENFPRARSAPDASGAWLPPGAPAGERDQRPGAFRVTNLLAARGSSRGALVEVAPHDVAYDSERHLWFADIEIDAGATYFPFVRLALARYQPTSIDGAHLSDIVLADFMALTADRSVSLSAPDKAGRRRVTVWGVRPYRSSAHEEARQAPSMSLQNLLGQPELLSPANVAESTVIEVWIERLQERLGEDFGWTRVSDAWVSGGDRDAPTPPLSAEARQAIGSIFRDQAMAADRLEARAVLEARGQGVVSSAPTSLVTPWRILWDGDIARPQAPGRYRLVVAEYEEYLVDDDRPYDKVPTRKERRMVFVEHIELL